MKSKVPSLAELVGSVVGEHGSLETIVSVLAFIGVTPKTLNLLSTHFVKFLTDKSVSELRELLGASGAADMSAPTESIFMLHGDQKPFKVTITIQEQEYPVDGATLVSVLSKADVQTLCTLKGVNESWKAVARRVLCQRLYPEAVPETLEQAMVINIEPFLTQNGLGVEHVDEAVAQLTHLQRMVADGFEVNVDLVRNVGEMIAFSEVTWVANPYDVLSPVRQCISPQSGLSSPEGSLLLAVCAACYHTTFVPSGAWFEDNTLESIVIPTGITRIGTEAFSRCSILTSVILPATVTFIDSHAFESCIALTTINLPAALTSINSHAFRLCSILDTVIFSPAAIITSIGEGCFAECSRLQNINLPASLTSIGIRAFHSCTALTTINLPAAIITSIPSDCFGECSRLQNINLPASLTSIGSYAFYKCRALTTINLPASLTKIDDSAFQDCSALTKVMFPVTDTPLTIGSFAFYGCASLNSITLPDRVAYDPFAFPADIPRLGGTTLPRPPSWHGSPSLLDRIKAAIQSLVKWILESLYPLRSMRAARPQPA